MKLLLIVGITLAGGLAGFVWAKVVGCPDGGCPLTATPWRGAFVGLFMGAALAVSLLPAGGTKQADEAAPPGDDAVVHIKTAAEFDALLGAGSGAIVVDFYADWCGPCRNFAPELAGFAGTHRGTVTVVKVNVDNHPELAKRYSVTGIPAILLFHGGKLVRQTAGAMSAGELDAWVKQ